MCATLNSELRAKYNVRLLALDFCAYAVQIRSLPVRKDDEVLVIRGDHKGKEGKVVSVYRKRWSIFIEKVTREKANGPHCHFSHSFPH